MIWSRRSKRDFDRSQHVPLEELAVIAHNARWWGDQAVEFFRKLDATLQLATFEAGSLREHRALLASSVLHLLWEQEADSPRMVAAMTAAALRCAPSSDLYAAISRSRDVTRNLEAIAADHETQLLPRTSAYVTASLLFALASDEPR